MKEFKKYKDFILTEESRNPTYYRLTFNEIHIYVDDFIKSFKNEFGVNSWFIYNTDDSISLEYFISSSDVSPDNIMKMKKFMFDNSPYFRDLIIHRDDNRIVLKFVNPGEPIKFKFFH